MTQEDMTQEDMTQEDMTQEDMSRDVQKMRLLRACALVLAVICAVPGVDAVARQMSRSDVHAGGHTSFNAGYALAHVDAFEALDSLEDELERDKADMPEPLAAEIDFPSGASDVRVDETKTVVSYLVEGGEEGSLASLESSMREAGWTAIPLGEACGATFVKTEGHCRWALATCTRVGEKTSVVIRCAFS